MDYLSISEFPLSYDSSGYHTDLFSSDETFTELMSNTVIQSKITSISLDYEGAQSMPCKLADKVIRCGIARNNNS